MLGESIIRISAIPSLMVVSCSIAIPPTEEVMVVVFLDLTTIWRRLCCPGNAGYPPPQLHGHRSYGILITAPAS
jgi:hypothetical protein